MRDFTCPNCGQHLAFENSVCLSCGSALGFSLNEMALLVIASGEDSDHGGAVDASRYQLCANLHLAECNWLVEVAPVPRKVSVVCADPDPPERLRHQGASRVRRGRKGQAAAHRRTVRTETADRGTRRGSPVRPGVRPALQRVRAGVHRPRNGVITLDLAEGDDVHREQLRTEMDEPYRTLLGHFRHEIGHYYYYRVVDPSQAYSQRFRELFGDPDADYQAALDRHYNEGAPPGWDDIYVSSYATMHPAEDWAETFAHYLHIRDTLDTAAAFGVAPAAATFERRMLGPSGFDTIIDMWLPLAWALNMVNRSMGKEDLYLFVLPPAVLEKMRFVHTIIDEITSDRARLADVSGAGQQQSQT